MTKARLDGLYLLLLGCAAFLLFGFALEHMLDTGMGDFKAVYYSSLTLVQHHDPYREADLLQTFQANGGKFSVIPTSCLLYTSCRSRPAARGTGNLRNHLLPGQRAIARDRHSPRAGRAKARYPQDGFTPVSYTHLDVYKRQEIGRASCRERV